jgi:hypothetical protein
MGPIGYTETSVRNYHYSLRNNPKDGTDRLCRIVRTKLPLACIMDGCYSIYTNQLIDRCHAFRQGATSSVHNLSPNSCAVCVRCTRYMVSICAALRRWMINSKCCVRNWSWPTKSLPEIRLTNHEELQAEFARVSPGTRTGHISGQVKNVTFW